ncbi:polymorphic toxin type 15 domain-containing protein, partial [Actinomyces acetigenes]|uniref:polymorphic toxin type 15 domain-containing protein n=1 Tax=Actinomyces acetigenes TaxID=3050225 RepID=UPI002852D510
MTRQLDGQFTALSLMSAKEILAGMATFDERKRSPASHTRIRKDFQEKLASNLKDRHGFAKDVAGLWASRAMRELAVLHNPDQLLSGPQGPSLVGG